uniref:Transmembrane protein n=1 Tax=Parascaris univalens TaxID=6257 RepID=A0A915C2K7_PARUN
TTASSIKSAKWSVDRMPSADDDANELESVPLPIQTFLWRQTNPFLGAKIGKLHEASCVTFERVVVQNILHGLSPSLSDAIGSVSRWRFVRAAFPHIVQCCASLIAEAKTREEHSPISASLTKILYILHWLLLDSANECCDSDSGNSVTEAGEVSIHSVRPYTFSINSIQLFVYLLAPLVHVITEDDIASHIRLESGLKIWQSLWQYRQPDVLCFCAPVKQRRSQLPLVALARKAAPTSAAQGIYLGDESEAPTRRLSQIQTHLVARVPSATPPPKPPRTDLAVLSSLKKKREREKQKELANDKTADTQNEQKKSLEVSSPTSFATKGTTEEDSKTSIVRSVSEYRADELVTDVRQKFTKSNTTAIFDVSPSVTKGMDELDEALRFVEDNSLSEMMVELSDKAPLVQLQEICSCISADVENSFGNGCEVVCENCNTVVYREGTVVGVCKCKRKSSSTSSRFKIVSTAPKDSQTSLQTDSSRNTTIQREETTSTFSGRTVIRRPTITVETEVPKDSASKKEFDPLENISMKSDVTQQALSDPHEATYLDVAVIRCLLIKHWSENGVYWAMRYLLNRLADIDSYRSSQEGMFRSRANSAPTIPHLKIYSSEMDSRLNLPENQFRAPTWDDLQLNDFPKNLQTQQHQLKPKVAFNESERPRRRSSASEPIERNLKVDDEQRRNSFATTSSTPRSRDKRFRIDRNRSDPSISNSSEFLSNRETHSGSMTGLQGSSSNQDTSKQFFPEALGSSNFIEKNGHISFMVILKAVNLVVERCSAIRICELALNLCDSLLSMPAIDYQQFFDEIIKTILRIYLWLGCPHGCNEGIRSAQGDFLRVKARTIFATMQRIDPKGFSEMVVNHVQEGNSQTLIDMMHAITGFCRADLAAGAARPRSNSSPRRRSSNTDCKVPTYRNHFNEKLKGIEGAIINAILKPVISKLMNTMSELLQPENMSLYQDVRLFVSFIQERHGNPFRRVALSALLDARLSTDQRALHSTSVDIVESKSDYSEEGCSRTSPVGLTPSLYSRDQASLRRGLFKRKERMSNADESDIESSPSTPRNVTSGEETMVVGPSTSPLLPPHCVKKKSGGKLHFAFNLLKSVRSENNDEEGSDSEFNEDGFSQDGNSQYENDRRSRLVIRRTSTKLQHIRQRASTESIDEDQEAVYMKRTPLGITLPPKKLVNLRGVQEGVRRFVFFLETCRPGSFPDAPLLAALLDLKSPVLGRAALILECAHFVHRCNRGDWPEWIRSGTVRQLSMMGYGGALGNRGTPSATRRMHMMQRAAGRCFYHWAHQIGDRIHKLMERDGLMGDKSDMHGRIDLNKRQLKIHDELEDFFDEGIVNDESGEVCPQALRLLACLLLDEITAFIRETFQTIPPSRTTKTTSGAAGWEKLMSHRRWSIISNTFNPQQQPTSGSIQSIADLNPALHQASERRISFSTNEEDSSPRGSHDAIDEAGPHTDKKARRLAQGRQRLLKRGSPIGQPSATETSSKRRPSLRMRKQSRNQGTIEIEREEGTEMVMPSGVSALARDSLKPTLSTSVYSEDGIPQTMPSPDLSHERSGIVGSCPPSAAGSTSRSNIAGGPSQLPASSYDDEEELMFENLPWVKVVIGMANSFNLKCKHERYCHPWCFERVYRQCYRLTEALRKVYGDDLPSENRLDKRRALIDSWNSKQETMRKSMQRHSCYFPRRESANVRQGALMDKTPMALRGLLIEKLNEIEEGKEARAKKAANKDSDDLIEASQLQTHPRPPNILNYLRTQVLSIAHAPLSTLLKSCLILKDEQYSETINVSWQLLVHSDAHLVATAASLFIVTSVKRPDGVIAVMQAELSSTDAGIRSAAIRRFHALWRNRFHVWLKMEDGAQMNFKVPPPGIDFTLPSPPIGQSQCAVVDPPWMPHVKNKVEELSLKEEEHATSQTIMTMTRTRRKQKQEMVKRAVREAEERQCALRQKFPLRATPIVQQAAYEPALFHHQLNAQQVANDPSGEEGEMHTSSSRQQMPVAQPLFPSSILSVVPTIIEMLDDVQVDTNGISVSDVAKKVIWSCIVEDPALFLRHFLEKLTNRDRQEYLMSLLRKLILRFRPFPSQTAYSLLNYLFGFVMYYVRSPCEGSDKAIAMALSLTWLIAPHVHGLYFKDLKQTLKKEQCDQALMITANVPSAKKIIVHGPDSGSGGIPSQFLIHEDTIFQQLLTDSLEFFNIPENEVEYYFLVDTKTNLVHMPSSYVRDFYFFHRSLYPQITLQRIDPDEAQLRMRQMAFTHKLIESGKVLLTHNALKHSPENVIPQRIFFLHDEFTHLPSFPRKSLEACFGMYNGPMGPELHAMDALHKFVWAQLMSDMFEKMENAFMFGDLHLFINVINGVMLMHCEDVIILRRCMATYISMAVHFSTLFASQGFFLIMPTLLRCYSQRQTNALLCRTIEYVCKQFYILHRKPFFLQMAGAVANILDTNDNDFEVNPMKVKAKYLFALLRSMEDMSNLDDPLDILGLVNETKPLKALDLCYRDDPNTFSMLTDGMASCVTVCAFAPDSRRSYQMLLVMQATLPYFVEWAERETIRQNNSSAAVKHELTVYSTVCVEMKALVNCCDILARGPTRTFDIVNSVSDRGKSFIADSPQFFDPPTVIEDEGKVHYSERNSTKEKKSATGWENAGSSEMQREMFRRPRDAMLVLAATFIDKATPRIKDLAKLTSSAEHVKIPEVFDHKCHVKLSEIALSLLKVAPYDLNTMACLGLQKYFTSILPVTDWSVEGNRSALNIILRRLDKTIQKIGKKLTLRRRTNWTALSNWLSGLYQTLSAYPYIAHLHPLKTTTQMCLRIMVGDPCIDDISAQSAAHSLSLSTVLHASTPPPTFCNAVLKLASFLMQALGQYSFSLEFLCSVEGIGPTADRLEAVLCHVLIPLFLRAATASKDAPQLQSRDLAFCLNLMHNAINPPLAKQSLAPVVSTNLATTLIRASTAHDTAGRQGSVSVTDRGHSATVSTHRIVRETVCQAVILALKVMMVAFQKQMTTHWSKVSKIVRELVGKKIGGTALYSFTEFVVDINLPISLVILPILQSKANQKPTSEQEAIWQADFKERLSRLGGTSTSEIRSYSAVLDELFQELQAMKEDFATRPIEVAHSHTPTVELHSETGSTPSVTAHRLSYSRPANEPRRLSSQALTKISRVVPPTFHKSAVGEAVVEGTILEDTEDENTQMMPARVVKSPSLPINKRFGMWRSMRRKSRPIAASEGELSLGEGRSSVELHEIPFSHHRRTRSCTRRYPKLEEALALPLNLEEPLAAAELSTPINIETRSRVVSFTMPTLENRETTSLSEDDDLSTNITARHHYV